jgi:hypothetical protein
MLHPTHPRKLDRRQQGSVLIIVLMIVMMTTGLATLAVTSATNETRSVGGIREVQRMRRTGEGFVMAVGSYLTQVARAGVDKVLSPVTTDTRWTAAAGDASSVRPKYGLPSYVQDPALYLVKADDLPASCYPASVLPLDSDLTDDGAVSPYELEGVAVVELHEMAAAAGEAIGQGTAGQSIGQKRWRAIVTSYTRNFLPDEAVPTGGRAMHERVGISRAFFDVRGGP